MPVGEQQSLDRTVDIYTRAGLPECVVSTMSGPPPETTQDRIQRTHTPDPRIEIKIPDSVGNRTRARRDGRQGLYRPRHGDHRWRRISREENTKHIVISCGMFGLTIFPFYVTDSVLMLLTGESIYVSQ